MSLTRRYSILLLVFAVLLVDVLAVKKFLPANRPAASADMPSDTTLAVGVNVPQKLADEEADHVEPDSLAALFPRMRGTPDLDALLALADQPNDLSNTIHHLTDNQCLQAFRRLQALPASEKRDRVLIEILVSFAEYDRSASLEQLASRANPEIIKKALEDEFFPMMWIRERPEQTVRWMVVEGPRFLDLQKLTPMVAQAAVQWAKTGPRDAANFLLNLPPDAYAKSPITDALRIIYNFWGIFDGVPTVLASIEAIPAGDPRKLAALLGTLDYMARTQPNEAKAFVERHLGVDPDAAAMAEAVGANLSSRPRDAAKWALSLAEPQARHAALNSLIEKWVNGEDAARIRQGGIPEAAAWAISLAPNEARGMAWGVVAAYWKILRPKEARDWLYTLPAGADRNEAMTIYANPPTQAQKDNEDPEDE